MAHDRARNRHASAKEALDALGAWLGVCLDDLRDCLDDNGLAPFTWVVLYGNAAGEEDGAVLERAVVAAWQGVAASALEVSSAHPAWAEIVELWADTRDVLGHAQQVPAPLGLVLDLDSRLAVGWCERYDDDDDADDEADLVVQVADTELSPLEELLLDAEAESAQALRTVMAMLADSGLDAPVPRAMPG